MRKGVVREYGHKRKFDFEDFDSREGRKLVKKRAHKRLRKQINIVTTEDKVPCRL